MTTPSALRPRVTRRRFLRSTAATAAVFSIVPRHVLGGARFVAPSEKVNIAVIGCGSQGMANIGTLFLHPDVQIIAVADPVTALEPNANNPRPNAGRKVAQDAIQKHYSAKTPNYKVADYEDFRVLLEKESAVDAVLCATPDHQHAIVSIRSMLHGKHVYCEKPLTHNVWEARQVAKVASETGVATQLGNQGHSGDSIRTTCEIIWSGEVGQVHEVHAWTSGGRSNRNYSGGLPPPEPAPDGTNWDLWLGAREARPFSHLYFPGKWRDFWDFGTGRIGDFFCHNFDPACWALDLRNPLTVEASAVGGVDSYVTPTAATYTYEFGPRTGAHGPMPAVKAVWYDGGLMPPRPAMMETDDQLGGDGNGILMIGDKGALTCPGWAGHAVLLPGSRDAEYKRPTPTLPRSKGHHRDWIDACKGGPPASSNFGYGAALTEIGLLGIAALRTGKKLYWDAQAIKASNAPEADRFLHEQYRQGWEIA